MIQMWFFYSSLSLFVRWNKWLDVCKLKRISFGMHTLDMLLTRGKCMEKCGENGKFALIAC